MNNVGKLKRNPTKKTEKMKGKIVELFQTTNRWITIQQYRNQNLYVVAVI